MERNESVLLHIRSVRVNWKSNRTTGGKTGKQSCVGWQCHFKCWYQNQILGIIWHIIAKCLKHILKIGMAEWLMCLTGGGNYDCVKRFMILKMLKCFGHSLQKQWLFLGNRKASFCSHGNRLEGCSRRACAELLGAGSQLFAAPWSRGCGHIHVLRSCSWQGGVNWNSVVLFLLPV